MISSVHTPRLGKCMYVNMAGHQGREKVKQKGVKVFPSPLSRT